MQLNLKKVIKTTRNFRIIYNKIIITETLNNLFLAIIHSKSGTVLGKGSIGYICKKFKLQARKTPLSAELLGKYIGERLLAKGLFRYSLVVSRFTKIVKSAAKGISLRVRACKRIILLKKVSHNGVRLRVNRRK